MARMALRPGPGSGAQPMPVLLFMAFAAIHAPGPLCGHVVFVVHVCMAVLAGNLSSMNRAVERFRNHLQCTLPGACLVAANAVFGRIGPEGPGRKEYEAHKDAGKDPFHVPTGSLHLKVRRMHLHFLPGYVQSEGAAKHGGRQPLRDRQIERSWRSDPC